MKVIIRTITLDGWLIIGFLFLMGCTSLYILRQKVVMLRQARKGNETFSESFRSLENPVALLEKEEDYPHRHSIGSTKPDARNCIFV